MKSEEVDSVEQTDSIVDFYESFNFLGMDLKMATVFWIAIAVLSIVIYTVA